MSQKEMLINYVPGEECRIAITENGRLEELYHERASAESHVNNIYKGRVVNVEPSIQAAFIDFGLERNGFLHISDLHPKYFPGDAKEETEMVGKKTPRRERPPIQKCLRRGQEILVQVLKEGIGTKGPTLTSYLSVPGRFLVMMPDMERLGVSRKVDDDEARREMRDILAELKPPEGFGFIIRTAGIGQTKAELKRDLAYLVRLWKNIEGRMEKSSRVGELYTESDLVVRTIRDVFAADIERIIVDHPAAARRAADFLAIASPRAGSKVFLYKDAVPLFHRFDIERQIEQINARTVPLPSGGSLVIDSTEALVAIDVNSGKYRDQRDAEMTAFKINQEAVDEICRQLRLRDLGGVIVNDLIDMRAMKHRKEIETRMKNNLKNDRARTRIAPISEFGVLEMTRQRMRPSINKSAFVPCAACLGQGKTKSAETVVLDVMRRLALVMNREVVARIELTVSPDVAFQLLNRKRGSLTSLERKHNKPVLVRVNGAGPIDYIDLATFDARGGQVEGESMGQMPEPELEPVVSAASMEAFSDADFAEAEPPEPEVIEEAEESLTQFADLAAQMAADADGDGETTTSAPTARSHAAGGGGPGSQQRQPGAAAGPGEPGTGKRRRRRRGRRGRGKDRPIDGQPQVGQPSVATGGPGDTGATGTGEHDLSFTQRDQLAEDAGSDSDFDAQADTGETGESPVGDDGAGDESGAGATDQQDTAITEEMNEITAASELSAGHPAGVPGGADGQPGQPGQGKRRRRRRGGRGRKRHGQPPGPGQGQPQQGHPQQQQRGHHPQQQPSRGNNNPSPASQPPRPQTVVVPPPVPSAPVVRSLRPSIVKAGHGYSNKSRPRDDR